MGRKQVLKSRAFKPRNYFEAEDVAALEGVAEDLTAAADFGAAEDEDAQMPSLACSIRFSDTEAAEELAGSLSGAGRTAGLAFTTGATGATAEEAGVAPARGRSLSDGAAEVLVCAAGAVGCADVLTIRPLVSTLSTAEVTRCE